MIETTKVFQKYSVCLLNSKYKQHLTLFAYFFPKLFVLKEETGYFQKVMIVYVINSNLGVISVFYPKQKTLTFFC